MEPSDETKKSLAETDRDLEDLLTRCNKFMADAPDAMEAAINRGDMEEAQKIRNALDHMNETMGMIRYHPFSSRIGPSRLLPPVHHDVRSDTGKFSERGSQGHMLGYLNKALDRSKLQLKPSQKNPMVRRWQETEQQQPVQREKSSIDRLEAEEKELNLSDVSQWEPGLAQALANDALEYARPEDFLMGVRDSDGRLQGILSYRRRAYDNDLHVDYLASNQKGVGTRLMRYAFEHAVKDNVNLTLYSAQKAKTFYEHLGMTKEPGSEADYIITPQEMKERLAS